MELSRLIDHAVIGKETSRGVKRWCWCLWKRLLETQIPQ